MLALRAILPWLPHNKSNPFIKPVYVLTEPVLSVIKAGLPPNRIGMDVSPYYSTLVGTASNLEANFLELVLSNI